MQHNIAMLSTAMSIQPWCHRDNRSYFHTVIMGPLAVVAAVVAGEVMHMSL